MVEEDQDIFEWFDAFVDWMKELQDDETNLLNVSRVKDMNNAYKSIVESLRAEGCDAKVSCGYGELGSTHGYIQIEGRSIDLANLGNFVYASKLADNVEVYPLVNNKVRMAFTFHNFLRPI